MNAGLHYNVLVVHDDPEFLGEVLLSLDSVAGTKVYGAHDGTIFPHGKSERAAIPASFDLMVRHHGFEPSFLATVHAIRKVVMNLNPPNKKEKAPDGYRWMWDIIGKGRKWKDDWSIQLIEWLGKAEDQVPSILLP
jgi:hypothetical protein